MNKYLLLLLLTFVTLSGCKQEKDPKNEPVDDNMETKGLVHPEWSKNATIYEVNIRQYTPEGTIKAFEAHLPRLKEMGVDILWLMPIFPIGEENRKGGMGSYYAVKDYKAVNPDQGTMEDLKHLVQTAHDMDMHVILDWVANHTAWDNALTEEHPEWYTKDSATGDFTPPVEDWSDVIDLNYDEPGLRDYMIGALKFWVEEADVDGYRCDVAMMVPMDFWNEARAELDKVKPVFMLAEAEGPEFHEAAFDMTYGWEFHHIMNEIAQGKAKPDAITEYRQKRLEDYPEDAYVMHFITNHDENSWNGTVNERMGDYARNCAVLAATYPGMPLVYSGQEAGLDHRLAFFEKDEIEWKESDWEDLYTLLLNLNINNPALWNGEDGGAYTRLPNSNEDAVFAYVLEKGENKVFVALNFSDAEQVVTFESGPYYDEYTDVMTNEPHVIHKGAQFKIGAKDFVLLTK